jgi:hypothetical protein
VIKKRGKKRFAQKNRRSTAKNRGAAYLIYRNEKIRGMKTAKKHKRQNQR